MPKSYNFRTQMGVGKMGVDLAVDILRDRYDDVENYEHHMDFQARGIDIFVGGLGFVEVKTDLHTTKNFYFELSMNDGPGGLDKSAADYFAFVFPNERKMFLIKRPELQHWLRNWKGWYKRHTPDSLKFIHSNQGDNVWITMGLIVPWRDMSDMISVIATWADLVDGTAVLWEGDE